MLEANWAEPGTVREYARELGRLWAWHRLNGFAELSPASMVLFLQHLADAGFSFSTAEKAVSAARHHCRASGVVTVA